MRRKNIGLTPALSIAWRGRNKTPPSLQSGEGPGVRKERKERDQGFFCFYPHFTYICINKMNQQKGAATAPFSFLVWQTKQKYNSWKNLWAKYWQKNRNISWYPC